MLPGNAIVYTNAEGVRQRPRAAQLSRSRGKVDALGGFYGETITTLVEIRNSHGRGDFHERWIDDAFDPNGFSNIYVYERSKSAVVGLNSRNDSFIESRSGVQTDFAPNTILVELTGNATDPTVDPGDDIPETIRVNGIGPDQLSIPQRTRVARPGLRHVRRRAAARDAVADERVVDAAGRHAARRPTTARRGWRTST